jgi:hypothetical protein
MLPRGKEEGFGTVTVKEKSKVCAVVRLFTTCNFHNRRFLWVLLGYLV